MGGPADVPPAAAGDARGGDGGAQGRGLRRVPDVHRPGDGRAAVGGRQGLHPAEGRVPGAALHEHPAAEGRRDAVHRGAVHAGAAGAVLLGPPARRGPAAGGGAPAPGRPDSGLQQARIRHAVRRAYRGGAQAVRAPPQVPVLHGAAGDAQGDAGGPGRGRRQDGRREDDGVGAAGAGAPGAEEPRVAGLLEELQVHGEAGVRRRRRRRAAPPAAAPGLCLPQPEPAGVLLRRDAADRGRQLRPGPRPRVPPDGAAVGRRLREVRGRPVQRPPGRHRRRAVPDGELGRHQPGRVGGAPRVPAGHALRRQRLLPPAAVPGPAEHADPPAAGGQGERGGHHGGPEEQQAPVHVGERLGAGPADRRPALRAAGGAGDGRGQGARAAHPALHDAQGAGGHAEAGEGRQDVREAQAPERGGGEVAPEPAAEGGQVHQRGPLRRLAGALPPPPEPEVLLARPPSTWWLEVLVQPVRVRLGLPARAVVVRHDLLRALGTLSRVRPRPTSPCRAGADACASRSPRRTARTTSERAGGTGRTASLGERHGRISQLRPLASRAFQARAPAPCSASACSRCRAGGPPAG